MNGTIEPTGAQPISEQGPLPYKPVKNLANRLRNQALNVESSGWITAARLMNHAADEIEEWRRLNGVPSGED